MTDLALMPKAVMSPEDALKSREEFSAMVKKALVQDQDFGKVPGTDKDTLLQPGADKLLNFYGLTSRTVCVEKTENWDRLNPFFMYRYKSSIVWPRPMADGTIREEVIAECEGSCNSMETKYGDRWVSYEELSADQKKAADEGKLTFEGRDKDKPLFIIEREDPKLHGEIMDSPDKYKLFNRDSKKIDPKTKKPYPVQWVTLPGVKMYQVPNAKVFDQVNTLQKMAQKRAYVGATIKAVKASDLFTQDMEDMADNYQPGIKTGATTVQTQKQATKPDVEEAVIVMEGMEDWVEALKAATSKGELDEIMTDAVSQNMDEAGMKWLRPHFERALSKLEKKPAPAGTPDEAKYRAMLDAAKDGESVLNVWKTIPQPARTNSLKAYYTSKLDEHKKGVPA